jgi:hypothetical protein
MSLRTQIVACATRQSTVFDGIREDDRDSVLYRLTLRIKLTEFDLASPSGDVNGG